MKALLFTACSHFLCARACPSLCLHGFFMLLLSRSDTPSPPKPKSAVGMCRKIFYQRRHRLSCKRFQRDSPRSAQSCTFTSVFLCPALLLSVFEPLYNNQKRLTSWDNSLKYSKIVGVVSPLLFTCISNFFVFSPCRCDFNEWQTSSAG